MTMISCIREGERLAPEHYSLSEAQWRMMITRAPGWFIAQWCDDNRAYALFLDQKKPLMASTALVDGRYFALSAAIPAASWHERIAQDLWGSLPLGAANTNPAVDRGHWTRLSPLSRRSLPSIDAPPSDVFKDSLQSDMPPFAWAAGAPIPGGAHYGLIKRLIGCTAREALRFVGRSVAAGFVAVPLAYAQAIEQALGISVSDEIRDARIILREIERISVHYRDIALLARLTGFSLLATHATLAEDLCAQLCAQHGATRRLTDVITLGGIAENVDSRSLAHAVYKALMPRMALLEALHSQMAECLEGLGTISPARAQSHCLGGLLGRASGRYLDLRQFEDDVRHEPGRTGSLLSGSGWAGDSWARQCLRLDEIDDSLRRIERIAAQFGTALPLPASQRPSSDEGIGAVEGAHGDIWCWVRLKDSRLDGLLLRDPALVTLSLLPSLLCNRWEDRLILASLGYDPGGAEQ